MNIAELRERIESFFSIGEPTDMAFAVTGEPYVTISVIGDGLDEDKLCMMAFAAFDVYAMDRPGKAQGAALYWRVYPELDRTLDGAPRQVYMRLLISKKGASDGASVSRAQGA